MPRRALATTLYRRFSRVERAALGLVLLAVLAPLPFVLGGCGYSLALVPFLYSGGGGGGATSGSGAALLALPLTDAYEGCLVIPNGTVVSSVVVQHNQALVPIDGQVPSAHQALIAQELVAKAIYNPAAEYLQFFRTPQPITVAGGDQISVSFVQTEGGQPPPTSRIGFGGTNLADLQDGLPLANFQAHDDPIADAGVPGVGAAGLALLVCGLLVFGLLQLRRRRVPAC